MRFLGTEYLDARGWFSAYLAQSGWFDQEVAEDAGAPGTHAIVGAGGSASEEAVGAPTLTWPTATGITTFAGPMPRRPYRVLDHTITGAGGIESAEAVGRPALIWGARTREARRREERWLLAA